MTFPKSVVRGLIAVLISLHGLTIFAVSTSAPWLDTALPWIAGAGTVSAIAILAAVVLSHRAAEVLQRATVKLNQEVRALNSHAMVLRTDADTCITHVNEKLLEVTGYTAEDLLGKRVTELYVPDDVAHYQLLRRVVERGGSWEGESLLRTRSGAPLWSNLTIMPGLDDRGRPCGSISVRTDISATKKAQAREKIFAALDRLMDEVIIFDSQTFTVKYSNQAANRSRGKDTDAEAPTGLRGFGPLFESRDFLDSVQDLLDSGDDFTSFQIDRTGRAFELRLQVLRVSGAHTEIMAVLRDISAEKEMETLRNEFISTVSHELRSPMTSIKGSMGLLLAGAGGELPDKVRVMLEIAHRNADRLVDIINDLLDIEKISTGNMTFHPVTVELDALINEAMLANQHFADRFDVTVQREDTARGEVMIDFDRTLQVLNNLLSNASKFSRPGGTVIVRLDDTDDSYQISVQDFGRGIPEDMQPRIFEKFLQIGSSSDVQVRGTGLGLAIVKAIVEQQGGQVDFESAEGVGTTFFVRFPKTQAGAMTDSRPLLKAVS